ncbi:hypothetical protein EWW49_36465, partial [Pseudomonas syringae]
ALPTLPQPEAWAWGDVVQTVRSAGRQVGRVSVEQWQAQRRRYDSQNALFGGLGFYLDGFEEDIDDISMIEHRNTLNGIRRMGEQYPPKTPALLRRGCDYLQAIDFI